MAMWSGGRDRMRYRQSDAETARNRMAMWSGGRDRMRLQSERRGNRAESYGDVVRRGRNPKTLDGAAVSKQDGTGRRF